MRHITFLLLAFIFVVPSAARGAVQYSVCNLSAEWDATFDQPEIVQTWYATAINNSGQIAGSAFKVDNKSFAITWDSTSGLRDFLDIEGATKTYCINNLGQIAVNGYPADYLWDKNTGLQPINGWGSGGLSPYDINDLGQVVGAHWPDNDQPSAFFWENGIAQEIENLGGEYSESTAINNLGQVVGLSGSAVSADAFLWDAVNGTENIGTGFYSSIARDINDHGQIVGNAVLEEEGDWHAVLWGDDEIIDLDVLIGESFSVSSINNLGQVIGSVKRLVDDEDGEDVQRYAYSAAIWDSIHGLQIIDDLIPGSDWRISTLTDINDSGWIIGSAFNNDLGCFQKVLLKPVPEPSCFVLVAIGSCFVSFISSKEKTARRKVLRRIFQSNKSGTFYF